MATAIDKAVVAAALGNELVSVGELGATAATVSSSSGTVYLIKIDNHRNENNAVYVKIYDSASPTVGTDIPVIIMMAAPGQMDVIWHDPLGAVFGTAITAACVTAAGTGGDVSPTNAVDVVIYI